MCAIAASCTVSSCGDDVQDRAASGVARLSAAAVAALVQVVAEDTRCGFASEAALDSAVIRGPAGGAGTVRTSISRCAFDFDENPQSRTDCNGVTTTFRGKVVVTASSTTTGLLTGRRDAPVIPSDPDAAVIVLERVDADDFEVVRSDRDARLLFRDGSFSATVRPRLGTSASTGACSVPTPNLTIENLRLDSSNLFFEADDASGYIFVPISQITARIGSTSGGENQISGSINFFTREIVLPNEEDSGEFDDQFELERFRSSYACNADLLAADDFTCGFESDPLADGAARLTIQNLGAMTALLDADATCGFSSPNVLARAEVIGEVGGLGELVLRTEACVIEPPGERRISEDCKGGELFASGRFTATATRRIRGRVTGDFFAPIIPSSDSGATIVFDRLELQGFRARSSRVSGALTQVSGVLTATVTPRLAARAGDGACTEATPIVRFDEVRYRDAVLRVEADGTAISIPVASSELSALAGVWAPEANRLSGTIEIAGKNYAVPTERSTGLDPRFEPIDFDDRWKCEARFAQPISHRCDPLPLAVDGAARLTVLTFETVQRLIEADARCGFSSPALEPVVSSTITGAPAVATWTLPAPCTLAFGARSFAGRDCLGLETYVRGQVQVRGTRRATGIATGDPEQPVAPSSRLGLEYALALELEGFEVTTSSGGSALTVLEGGLSGVMRPLLAIDQASDACLRPTRAAEYEQLQYSDARLRFTLGGLPIDLDVPGSALGAVRGRIGERENTIRGTLQADGAQWLIPVDPRTPALFAGETQETLDARVSCEPGLVLATSDAQCVQTSTTGFFPGP